MKTILFTVYFQRLAIYKRVNWLSLQSSSLDFHNINVLTISNVDNGIFFLFRYEFTHKYKKMDVQKYHKPLRVFHYTMYFHQYFIKIIMKADFKVLFFWMLCSQNKLIDKTPSLFSMFSVLSVFLVLCQLDITGKMVFSIYRFKTKKKC